MGARDAGAGEDIVELVDEQLLIERSDIRAVRRLIVLHGIVYSEYFKVSERELSLAVVALYDMLVCERAAVQLKIELACVCIGLDRVSLNLFHCLADELVLGLRAAIEIGAAFCRLDHLELRSAAAVSVAVGDNAGVGDTLILDAGMVIRGSARDIGHEILGIGPDVGAVEMGEHLCAIDTLPIESIKRESVGVVPVNFSCQEIIDAAAFHYLRDSRAVAESIGQPEAIRGEVEIFSRESLTPEELSDHRLAGGYVAVALDPHAAVGLVSALFDLLLNAREEVGIFAAQEVAVARGALDKFIFRILVHERELVCIGARALLDCLADMPEPRGVHMRMSDEHSLRCIVAVFDGECFFKIGLRSLESRHELVAVNIVG